ncbi:hypothetical protein PTKIN_Ptkin02bG0146600 [Pterospermum kingtungense]
MDDNLAEKWAKFRLTEEEKDDAIIDKDWIMDPECVGRSCLIVNLDLVSILGSISRTSLRNDDGKGWDCPWRIHWEVQEVKTGGGNLAKGKCLKLVS